MTHPIHFLLSNTYGHPNVGDEAIVTAMLDQLSQNFKGAKLSVLTAHPQATQKRHKQARAVHSQVIRGSLTTLKTIKESDLLIVGGGGIIQDATSLGNLLFHLSRALTAYLVGTPFMCYAVGVGPLHSRIARRLTATVLNKAQAITVRDRYSGDLLTAVGVPQHLITVTADPVMMLPFSNEAMAHPIYQTVLQAEKAPLIGISLRPILDKYHILPGEYAISDATAHLIKRIAAVATELRQEMNARFLFASMHPQQDDAIGHLFAKLMGNDASVIIAPGSLPPQTMMSIIGLSDLLIGMRLHSLILAARSAVPMVALSYAPKVSGFLTLLGQENQALGLADWTVENIQALTWATWSKRADIKYSLQELVPLLQERAQVNIKVVEMVLNKMVFG